MWRKPSRRRARIVPAEGRVAAPSAFLLPCVVASLLALACEDRHARTSGSGGRPVETGASSSAENVDAANARGAGGAGGALATSASSAAGPAAGGGDVVGSTAAGVGVGVGVGVGAGGGDPEPDCSAATDRDVTALTRPDSVRTAGGTVWTWSDHHYVERDGTIVGSEIWSPWMACGRASCLVGTNVPGFTFQLPELEQVESTAMVPWAGDLRTALLLAGAREVYQRRDGEPAHLVAVLPIDAAIQPSNLERPFNAVAGRAGTDVVWAAVDGSIRRTSLVDGITSLIAEDQHPTMVTASGTLAAWRRGDDVHVVDLGDGGQAVYDLPDGSGAKSGGGALALHDGACLVGVESDVWIVPAAGGPARIVPLDHGDVDLLAADACGVAVVTTELRTLYRTAL